MKKIVIIIGLQLILEHISHFLSVNANLLSEEGMSVLGELLCEPLQGVYLHKHIYDHFEFETLPIDFHNAITDAFTKNLKILIIINDWKTIEYSQTIFSNFSKYLDRYHNDAQIYIFVYLIHQCNAIERHLAHCYLGHRYVDVKKEVERFQQYDFLNRIKLYEKIFKHYDLSITNLPDINNVLDNVNSIKKILFYIGAPSNLFGSLDFTPAPYTLAEMPRDFLHFAYQSKLVTQNAALIYPNHWSTQAKHFTHRMGFPYGFPLLSPKQQNELLSFFASCNSKLKKIVNIEYTPYTFCNNDSWLPFLGLTQEIALTIAERLDHDFAEKRITEFDSIPQAFLSRDQRLIHKALHDAHDLKKSVFQGHMTSHPRISVLTLCYNHKKFISNNIESVLEQNINFPVQHIIADDESDDGCQNIILKYAKKYKSIIPIFRKGRNYERWDAIRSLFDMARTEYVAICDGDDYFTDPTKLQTQVDFLDAHKDCALCFHVVRVTYENQPEKERLYPPINSLPRGVHPFYYLSDLIRFNFIQTNSVMYRWRFKDGLPDWFRSDLMPGDWYWHLLHAELGKIGFINKVMSVYRRHDKGVYWLSEVDKLKHRAKVGMKELEVYNVVNEHFHGRYETILSDLANGVFADCLLYDTERAEEEGEEPILPELCDKYPKFGQYFLNTLKYQTIIKQLTKK
jgi:glycosyltransferase involved in cell wall biosynthesis